MRSQAGAQGCLGLPVQWELSSDPFHFGAAAPVSLEGIRKCSCTCTRVFCC